jgi:uncharacterized repeat protein (TIGR03803 family)
VIFDASGALYGTTEQGGDPSCSFFCGTVFKLTPPTTSGGAWTESVLHSFTGSDGSGPLAGLVADANSDLFGTTSTGGASGLGTVFEIVGSGFVPPALFAGTRRKANCQSQSVSTLAQQYGGLNNAAAALGYPIVSALQNAMLAFCEA